MIWGKIGFSSFGGGVATLGLMRQEFIDRRGWISEAEFVREWSLCQLAPGINLIAMAILLGRRFGGVFSIVAAIVGLMLPAFLATVAITASYQHFANSPFIAEARRGMIPAVAGIGLATATNMALPLFKRKSENQNALRGFSIVVFAGCFLGFRGLKLSPIEVLLLSGAIGAVFRSVLPKEGGQAA